MEMSSAQRLELTHDVLHMDPGESKTFTREELVGLLEPV